MTQRETTKRKGWLTAALTLGLALAATAAQADTWRGTAPFCSGSCLPGEQQVATSNCGDSSCCWSGHKVLCRNTAPLCQGLQTNTSCYGVVLVCDNGYYINNGNNSPTWQSCSKYACGVCVGLPF